MNRLADVGEFCTAGHIVRLPAWRPRGDCRAVGDAQAAVYVAEQTALRFALIVIQDTCK